MKDQDRKHGTQLVDILLFIFKAFYVLFWITTVGISLVFFIGIFHIPVPAEALPANFPVYFSLPDENGVIQWLDKTAQFSIPEAMGTVTFTEVPLGLLTWTSAGSLLMIVAIQLSIRHMIRILRSAKSGDFLIVKNAIRLRWIALLTILVFFIDRTSAILTSSYLSSKMTLSGFHFSDFNIFSFMNFETVFINLFLLIVAEVFRIGSELREEQALTI